MTPLVSVVVPTYKRPELLKRCLAALLAQDIDPASYEIIVADDAVCEETRRLVEGHATRAPAAACEDDTDGAIAAMVCGTRAQMLGARYSVATQSEALIAERRPQVRYLPVIGPHGPAAARNVGWRAAKGALVAF